MNPIYSPLAAPPDCVAEFDGSVSFDDVEAATVAKVLEYGDKRNRCDFDSVLDDDDDVHLRTSPPSGKCVRLRPESAVLRALIIVLAALAAYQAGYIGNGNSGERRPSASTANPPDIFYGGDCPYAPTADPDPNMTGPRVVWKMSFPNSGTSYTERLVKSLTNYTSAKANGRDYVDESGRSVPLRADSPDGPFLTAPGRIPAYVLTKVHCGGRCAKCGPDSYVETQGSFETACRTGTRVEPRDGKKGREGSRGVKVRHGTDLVQRAVHVLRDPFDNVVSRYHMERHHWIDRNETERLDVFTPDAEGFRSYCEWLDGSYAEEERSSYFLGDDVLELFDGVPCHGEFYKYARWHALAAATRDRLRLPTHVLYYENYGRDFDGTVDALLAFLQQTRVGPAEPKFIGGKTYRSYYTKEEREAAMRLIRRSSSPAAWRLLERYASV